MPSFSVEKVANERHLFEVKGLPKEVHSARLTKRDEGRWCLSIIQTGKSEQLLQFHSITTGLAYVGLRFNGVFESERDPDFDAAVNAMIGKLETYKEKKSVDELGPGKQKKEAVRQADQALIDKHINILLRNVDGVYCFSFMVTHGVEIKYHDVSDVELLEKPFSVLCQEARLALGTDKPFLGESTSFSTVFTEREVVKGLLGKSSAVSDDFYDVVQMGVADNPQLYVLPNGHTSIYQRSSLDDLCKENTGLRGWLINHDADKTGIKLALIEEEKDPELTEEQGIVNALFSKWVTSFPQARYDVLKPEHYNLFDPADQLVIDRMQASVIQNHRLALTILGHKLTEAVKIGFPDEIKDLVKERNRAKGDARVDLDGRLLSLVPGVKDAIKNQLAAMRIFENTHLWSEVLEVPDALLDRVVGFALGHLYKITKPPFLSPKSGAPLLSNIFEESLLHLRHKQVSMHDEYEGRLKPTYDLDGRELPGSKYLEGEWLDCEKRFKVVDVLEPEEQYEKRIKIELKETQLRDPDTRYTLEIDAFTDASAYQKILIAAIYIAHADNEREIDETLQAFVKKQIKGDEVDEIVADPVYLDNAKMMLFEYLSGFDDFLMPDILIKQLEGYDILPRYAFKQALDSIPNIMHASEAHGFFAKNGKKDLKPSDFDATRGPKGPGGNSGED